jgi:Mor family transcriptional regulator
VAKRIGLTEVQKSQIVNSHAMGVPQNDLARIYGCSRRSIYRVLVERAVITPNYTADVMKLLKKHNVGYSFLKELLEGK